MVNVIMQSIASFSPCVSVIIADVDTTDFDARDNPFRSIRVCTQTADVGFIPMAGKTPLLARGQVLQALQFAPRIALISGDVQMSRMRARVEPLTIGAH
ncbi:hypothetical protein [Halalkalicoccus sp. NIPERK01]|uniref:hypothetical protein n=1 Tax=Halalkalicoccus sp. NIPERK01 TaxID=3053469 RepID=UPI00256EEBDF|nr:hypothetical protein [Halalkalicoccus sp. NIPERK01]MDL5363162.1 hypothetical protein [Halalkalicoccus sp. NIPERK01]